MSTLNHLRRLSALAGASAAIVALTAGGCSSAGRTTARGWDFDGESGGFDAPAPGTAEDVWASPLPRGAVATGGNSSAAGAFETPNGANDGIFSETAMNRGGEAFGTPYGSLAVSTGRGPGARPAQFGVDAFGELPATDRPVAHGGSAMMFDGMEGLSQITFSGEGSSFDPCISRDGRFVVFASTQHRPTADIYLKPVHGRTVTQLTADPAHDIMPALSPDGQRVAFASDRSGNWDIYVMSVSGGQAVQLTSDIARELHPSWSPDGSKLVFCRLGEVSGRWEMWVMDLAQSKAAEFIGYGLFPRWCPVAGTGEQGRDKIVFQRGRERGDRAFSIWTVDYRPGDVSSPTEIASSTREALINPNWSADGAWVTYAAVPNTNLNTDRNGRPAAADLWIAAVNGHGRVNLTAGNFVNLAPTWGPDNRIYFVSDRGGVENIWSVGTEKAVAAVTGQRFPGHGPSHDTGHAHGHGPAPLMLDDRGTAHVPVP